jgi:hypothetical protein
LLQVRRSWRLRTSRKMSIGVGLRYRPESITGYR